MGSAPVVGVLALQGDVAEHLRALTQAGAAPVRVRRPEELAAVDGLGSDRGAVVMLDPPRYTVPTCKDDPVRGNPAAPITIVEFSDYQCPFCARVNPTLAKIRGRGITVLLVEHDMRTVMGVSDRVICLNQGRIIADGLPEEIQSHPGVVRAYLGERAKRGPGEGRSGRAARADG